MDSAGEAPVDFTLPHSQLAKLARREVGALGGGQSVDDTKPDEALAFKLALRGHNRAVEVERQPAGAQAACIGGGHELCGQRGFAGALQAADAQHAHIVGAGVVEDACDQGIGPAGVGS